MKTERIRALMASKGLSQAGLAREVGVTQPAIQQILNGSSSRSRHLPEIARVLGVSVPYLLGDTDDPAAASVPAAMAPEAMAEALGLARVREVDVSYGMGGGSFLDDYLDERWKTFDRDWLASITTSPASSLFVARGSGDSMMPTLLDSDMLLIDRNERAIRQQDRIWALTYGEVGMIKRLRRLPNDRYSIMSDSAQVSDFEAAGDEVHLIGRVIWIGRRA